MGYSARITRTGWRGGGFGQNWHQRTITKKPKRDPEKFCVNVGMSDLPPDQRFPNHKAEITGCLTGEPLWLAPLPELHANLNPMPFAAGAQMEMDLAEDLRREGYTVTGGH